MNLSDPRRFCARFAGRLSLFLERNPRLFAAVFSIVFLTSFSIFGALKPLWFDEISTVYHAGSGVAGLWANLRHGADGHPPLSYLAVQAAHSLFGESDFSTRLPSVAGFWIMSLCVFFFLARRASVLFAA